MGASVSAVRQAQGPKGKGDLIKEMRSKQRKDDFISLAARRHGRTGQGADEGEAAASARLSIDLNGNDSRDETHIRPDAGIGSTTEQKLEARFSTGIWRSIRAFSDFIERTGDTLRIAAGLGVSLGGATAAVGFALGSAGLLVGGMVVGAAAGVPLVTLGVGAIARVAVQMKRLA